MNWRSIAFLLESGVFLLIGLQARSIIGDALGGEMTVGRIFGGLRLHPGRRDRAAARVGVLRPLPAGAARS